MVMPMAFCHLYQAYASSYSGREEIPGTRVEYRVLPRRAVLCFSGLRPFPPFTDDEVIGLGARVRQTGRESFTPNYTFEGGGGGFSLAIFRIGPRSRRATGPSGSSAGRPRNRSPLPSRLSAGLLRRQGTWLNGISRNISHDLP